VNATHYSTFPTGSTWGEAIAGDQRAWADLVREHRGRLRAIAAGFRLGRSDAEDAMQMTWLDLLRSIGTLHSPDRVGAWLSTTMRRNCLRILQRQRWEVLPGELPPVSDPAAGVEEPLLAGERAQVLWRAAARLPDRQAALLRALFADGERSYAEISSSLSMPVGAIGPVRQRALRRLAQLLQEAGTPPEDLLRSA
jgi:RNA polymerase sigma factor (sigma-70 family)